MNEFHPDLLQIIVLVSTIGLLPLAVVTMTGFLKMSVVLFLIRNALGIQQTPPNLVLYGIALIMALYVTSPLIGNVMQELENRPPDMSTIEGISAAADTVNGPLKEHLGRFATEREQAFFLDATNTIWGEQTSHTAEKGDLLVLLPAFVSSELTRAFEIGFLLYIPFLIIDLVVSNILMAMGMMMVSPPLISVPLKIFLFVAVDGWSRLMHGLILSYGVS